MKISAVIPLYAVEAYLPDLLHSLSDQRPGNYELEVIFVDDGSPDSSADLAQQWLREQNHAGVVLHQRNAGVSAARNAGIDTAHGEWITFPDSDDLLGEDYFCNVAEFILGRGEECSLVSTRLMRLYEPEQFPRDVHALQFRFMVGDRCVSVREHPDFFQLNVASVFFRREDVLARHSRFRPGLHASEDALFVAEFLLAGPPDPTLGLVASAHYIYRRRATQDSAVDGFRTNPQSYIDRFQDGYRALMAEADVNGGVPEWLQSMFLYECQWILPTQLTPHGYADVLSEKERATVLAALSSCARFVSESRLFEYDATALPLESRLLLQLMAGRDLPSWVGAYRDRDGTVDVPIATGSRVEVRARSGGVLTISPDRIIPDYFGQDLLQHWCAQPPRSARVFVDGEERVIVERRWNDTSSQQRDRHRRRSVAAREGAIPAREHEVRVWKPVPGPRGELRQHLYWRVMLWRRRVVRAVKQILHWDRS